MQVHYKCVSGKLNGSRHITPLRFKVQSYPIPRQDSKSAPAGSFVNVVLPYFYYRHGQYNSGQYGLPSLYSLPPPRGGNIPVAQPQPVASQGPTHYRRPSDMSMAGHGGDEYQLRWPQSSFEDARPSGESGRSSNYYSDWNNSDGSQSTYHSRRS